MVKSFVTVRRHCEDGFSVGLIELMAARRVTDPSP